MAFPARLLAGLIDLIPVVDLGKYRKFVLTIVGVGVGVGTYYLGTTDQWVTLAIAALTSLGVYEVPNE